jgi:Bacterial protein of unknown function (DUF916)
MKGKTMRLSRIVATATLSAALFAGIAAVALADPSPVQGVGVQLTDTALVNFPTNTRAPWQSEPDIYIGTKDQGKIPDPFAPGTSRTYHVRVSNTGNVRETMVVYPAAATMSDKGVFSYSSTSSTSVNDASSWTTVDTASAVVAPGDSYTVTVTVTVPAGTRAGSYYAVLWAGPRVDSANDGITLAIHAGVREYLTVSA